MPSVFSSVSSVACTVLAASCFLYILTCLAPPVSTGKENRLRFPSNLRELQQLAELLQLYYSSNSLYVLVLFSSAYLYKQAFIIPGSALLASGEKFTPDDLFFTVPEIVSYDSKLALKFDITYSTNTTTSLLLYCSY
ncbi:Uncharacterized protein GBIM_01915, partial [Gryllus bimaculatus]